MNALVTYLKNVRMELAHVVWPDRKTAMSHVVLIVLISAVTAVFIAGLDYVLTQGVGYLIAR